MLREKKELAQSMRDMQVQEEQTTSPPLEASVAKEQSPALTTTTATQPQQKEQQVDSHQHHEHSSPSEEIKQHQQLQVAQSLPVETVRSIEDKKMEREKRASSVSERRKIFESSSSGSLDKKMTIQKREKTPGHSRSGDKDKNSNNSLHQHSTPLSHKTSDANAPKRFNFVSKPVMTVDDSRITTDSELKATVAKRSSSAGRAKNAGNLQHRPLSFCSTSEYQDFHLTKTSPILQQDRPSLMAAAATALNRKQQQQPQDSVSVDSHDSVLPHSTPAAVNHNDRLHPDTLIITTTAPASGGGNDSFSASFTSSGSEPVDSSMLSTDRSMSFSRMYSSGGEEAEAKRRLTAKKKREARRVTQPVDDELWKQISREDAEEEKREDQLQAEAEKLADELKQSEREKVYYTFVCVCVNGHACIVYSVLINLVLELVVINTL